MKLLRQAFFAAILHQAAWSQLVKPSAPPNPQSSLQLGLNAGDRGRWALRTTLGPGALWRVSVVAGLGTRSNSPKEYGPHWEGFGKRALSNLGTTAVGNTMEASLGSLWGEDPRYHRLGAAAGSVGSRLRHSMKMAFLAENQRGGRRTAYARFAAVPASQFISNTWRTSDERRPGNTGIRIGLNFTSRMAGNAILEFWPDLRRRWGSRRGAAKVPVP